MSQPVCKHCGKTIYKAVFLPNKWIHEKTMSEACGLFGRNAATPR